MGIRFACHVCEKRLNIKRELAGRRGICPVCTARIRIPLADAEKSTPVEQKKLVASGVDTTPGDVAINRHLPATRGRTSTADPSAIGDQRQGDSIDSLTEDTLASWYVRPPSGGQYGPATTTVLKQWIDEGRVATTALLWREGWPQWREACEALPEFAGRLPINRGAMSASGAAAPPEDGISPTLAAAESQSVSARVAEQAEIELARRSRSMRRIQMIGVLSVVALVLILVLAFIAAR